MLFLPHGSEGMGPEHSSARLERFLQLSAQHNIQVCTPTTPAQIFHLLRRQMLVKFRKPLIVMTPKSFLRNPHAISRLQELAKGRYERVITDKSKTKSSSVTRVLLCAGKIYYDLYSEKLAKDVKDTAIIRLEQLYPFPYEELTVILSGYKKDIDIFWCQEEPKNQGAWYMIKHKIVKCLQGKQKLFYIGRTSLAAPAGGYNKLFMTKQNQVIAQAFGFEKLTNEDE